MEKLALRQSIGAPVDEVELAFWSIIMKHIVGI